MIMLDVQDTLAGTVLANAPILPVSAKTGQGLAELKTAVTQHLLTLPPRPDNGRARLPIDRIFTLSGFGTVVTGTLLDGRFQIGDAVEILPGGYKGRIRGLQTHKTKVDVAHPGSRVAINLTGINRELLRRGDVVALPGTVRSTTLLDAAYRHLPDADAPLKHNMEVKLFLGASELLARARVLGAEQIEPGQTGWLQLACSEPVAILRGDRFIVRRPSPGATLGGGRVLDPHPGRRHRRFRPETTARLQTLAKGTPEEQLLQALQRVEPATESQLWAAVGMDEGTAANPLSLLLESGQIIRLDALLLTQAGYQRLADNLRGLLADYHQQYPLRLGLPREETRSRLKLKTAVFNPFIRSAVADGWVIEEKAMLRQPGHAIRFSPAQQAAIDHLLGWMAQAGINSPGVKECQTAVGEDVYYALVDKGQLRPISHDVVYTAEQYEMIVGQLLAVLAAHGRLNAAQVRDQFQTSRKYAIALLEHLDEQKITRRVGDERVLM
jgi:selenocysteine-specific elongation factor